MNCELITILLSIILQAFYIAMKIGKFEEKLTTIEKKQDKHNNIIERMYCVEDKIKAIHYRIDELKKEVDAKFQNKRIN